MTRDDPYVVYVVRAGAAVRGELRLPDGSIYPTVLARGWYPAGPTPYRLDTLPMALS